MGDNIKYKLFTACSLMQWKEENHTISAYVSSQGCKCSVKCRTCGLKNKVRGHLLANFMNRWQEFKPCQH